MEKTILYPFSILNDNSLSYLKTLQLAKKMAAKVVCFTVVQSTEKLDDVYLHLLALNGYYQTMSNDWQVSKIRVEHSIAVGNMKKLLGQYLEKENVDVLIKESPVEVLKKEVLEKWIKESNDQPKIISFSSDH